MIERRVVNEAALTRCKTCVMPTTRPDTEFVDGECSACIAHRKRDEIDWTQREEALCEILDKSYSPSGYDCIVPSSGGKDSTSQVIQLIALGARPLVVTASTDYLTDLGRRNIDNLANYATTIEITPNRSVRAELCRLGIEAVGDVSWPEHAAIFSVPFRVARDMQIPTIFYGECPQNAYGGPLKAADAITIDRRWVSEFGGLLGLRPADVPMMTDEVTEKDMRDYRFPDGADAVTGYFLGQFLAWDSYENAKIARAHGMWTRTPRVGQWPFENLDNAATGLHDYQGYLKYGYGRICAQLSVEIRHGMIERDEALTSVYAYDGIPPDTYADVDVSELLEWLDRDIDWLQQQLDAHTNWDLFEQATVAA